MKKPAGSKLPHSPCIDCPGWLERFRDDGSDITVQLVNAQGEAIVKNGVLQHRKHTDRERMVTKGWCLPNGPRTIVHPNGNIITVYDETCSDWTCETPQKHAYIDRLARSTVLRK